MSENLIQHCGGKRAAPKSEAQMYTREGIYDGCLPWIDAFQQVYRGTAFPAVQWQPLTS